MLLGPSKVPFDKVGGFPPTRKKGLLGVCAFIGNFKREDIVYLNLLTVIITDILKKRCYIYGNSFYEGYQKTNNIQQSYLYYDARDCIQYNIYSAKGNLVRSWDLCEVSKPLELYPGSESLEFIPIFFSKTTCSLLAFIKLTSSV